MAALERPVTAEGLGNDSEQNERKTTLVLCLRKLSNTKKPARAAISSAKSRLSGFEAYANNDFERPMAGEHA